MMIGNNYAQQVAHAKSNNVSIVNVDHTTLPVPPIQGEKDTVTLSDKALAMLNGTAIKEPPATYVRPEKASILLTQSNASSSTNENTSGETTAIDNRFSDMMQKILDQRLGIDSEKLEELDDKIEEIADNENMSPEEKQKALEALAEMREQIIEDSKELRKFEEETD